MSYKQSMFNYIYPTADNELLLYNSYGGPPYLLLTLI